MLLVKDIFNILKTVVIFVEVDMMSPYPQGTSAYMYRGPKELAFPGLSLGFVTGCMQ